MIALQGLYLDIISNIQYNISKFLSWFVNLLLPLKESKNKKEFFS